MIQFPQGGDRVTVHTGRDSSPSTPLVVTGRQGPMVTFAEVRGMAVGPVHIEDVLTINGQKVN